jgi:formate hydrogenlyase subunit 3/multisubunit Na+/H+ antiporter MnhD subunit
MSAPIIWILLPLIAAVIFLMVSYRGSVAVPAAFLSLFLAGLAMFVPIDTPMGFGSVSIKIAGSVQLLGRSFQFGAADGPTLALVYALSALWFFGSQAGGANKSFVPLALAIVALLIASLAVEPFLYAALLIEVAAMLTVPLFMDSSSLTAKGIRPSNRGALRFIIYQTLAMPLILFSGWMLSGVEASPGDLALTAQSGILLGLGFAFLLAIFPLYSWIPMMAEDASPYTLGFTLWLLPTFALLLVLGFLDRFAWLRTSSGLIDAIRLAGMVLVVSGGWLSLFQRHLGRMLAFAAITETGLTVLAVSLNNFLSLDLVFLLLIPRGIELAVWALGISVLRINAGRLDFRSCQGLARTHPIACIAVILSQLSMAGLPLLAGFPARLALWEQLAQDSLGLAFWLMLGLIGILIGAIRTITVFLMAPEHEPWQSNETRLQAILLSFGIGVLLMFGTFPQVMQLFMNKLHSLFEHLV